MPQFDLYCYSVQVFWSLITFTSFYFLLFLSYMPGLSLILKYRGKRKDNLAFFIKRECNYSQNILKF